LAAAEGLFETKDHAGLTLFGYTDREAQEVKYGIEFPWVLSFLSGNSFDTVVTGLNDFPEEYWPPLYVHILFNAMVIIGSGLIALALFALVWNKWLKRRLIRDGFSGCLLLQGRFRLYHRMRLDFCLYRQAAIDI
jgi:cytochrome d ubiquinol oxidase subunit I